MSTKKKILELLKSVERPGMGRLIEEICDSTYFQAECHSHHRYRGGLADHSLGVYGQMLRLCPEQSRESIILVSLLHDVCKARRNDWHPIGLTEKGHHRHGLRSALIAVHCGVPLSKAEFEAIARHMHHATNRNPLWNAIRKADHRDAALRP